MTHVLGERLKELAEDADQKKALKDVTNAVAKEKGKAAKAAKKMAQASKKARQQVEGKLAEVKDRLGGIELKLVKATSLKLAQADQIAKLKAALEACENKWYNEGFTDVEKSAKLVIHQARFHRFKEGWLVALQAMGVPDDSPLRNPAQIPYSVPSPPTQIQADAAEEEETTSMRELVQAIGAHGDIADPEVTRNLGIFDYEQGQQPSTKGVPSQQGNNAQLPPTDLAVQYLCF